jgi:hypothetical protein
MLRQPANARIDLSSGGMAGMRGVPGAGAAGAKAHLFGGLYGTTEVVP